MFEMLGHGDALGVPEADAQKQKDKYFEGMKWNTVEDFIAEV